MQVLLTISFSGKNYHGFQVQQNAVSVCEVLQNAMQKLYGVRPPVKGCSRTDSGVHAVNYCVSFTAPKDIPLIKLPLALNNYLPEDIRAISAISVSDDFHARYNAISKEYVYILDNCSVDDVFLQGFVYRYPIKLNIAKMRAGAKCIIGTHDFSAFTSLKCPIEDKTRTVHFLKIKKQGNRIIFHISANGYLYNMVRIIVGTLVSVGEGKITPKQVSQIIENKDRSAAGDTFAACGLYLYKVNYGDKICPNKSWTP